MRFLLVLLLGVALVAAKKKLKDNDWDELEAMLSNIDELEKKTNSEEDDDDIMEKDEIVELEELSANPCEDHNCGWGKECVIDKKNNPVCECIRECPQLPEPDQFDRVCSNQNETFDTLCHLYRAKCLCKHGKKECDNKKHQNVHLEYLGPCKELDECSEDMMLQFPERMADWLFQVMRDLKKREELMEDEWLSLAEEAEEDDNLKHVYPVIWKFCDLDRKPHDKFVTHHELIPITAPVMPMESCIKPFLLKCDADDDGKITINEWGKCLGLQDGEIVERC